jgi:peptide methionine sulfoxide reductase msrA/msrB
MKKQTTLALLALLLTLLPPLQAQEKEHTDSIILGMGCFWGAEKRMSALPGVIDVESGYANGEIEASYRKILMHESLRKQGLSQKRNHTEVVKVTFDTRKTDLESVLIGFWESHDPTQGDRQGNDIGSNYRSAIYTHSADQREAAIRTRDTYQQALSAHHYGNITTEITPLTSYTAAETYHQDYLKKNPNGYCGLGGTGVSYPGNKQKSVEQTSLLEPLDPDTLSHKRQLVLFEVEDCAYCKQFKIDIVDHWRAEIPIKTSLSPQPPTGWSLERALIATPTIVLFENGKEIARYTGYSGDKTRFWHWLDKFV